MSFIQEGKAHLKENELGVQDTMSYGLAHIYIHMLGNEGILEYVRRKVISALNTKFGFN